MSADEAGEAITPPAPRDTAHLFGHGEAERRLLDAYRDRRFPHAWLIGGPPGIGKATLAYRLARFVLAHPDPTAPEVRSATSLSVDADHPVARRIAAQAHGGLLVLERMPGETGVLRTEIAVDDVRRTVSFFGTTAGEGGWRICIIDAADDLNRSGANALLKVIEEPPPRALFLLVSHAPGRLVPTLRSRCRRLRLDPLPPADLAAALAIITGRGSDDAELREAAAAGEGSIARALDLLSEGRLPLWQTVQRLLDLLPERDEPALHTLGDGLGRANEGAFDLVVDAMRDWLSRQLILHAGDPARLARIAEVWEKLNDAARETEVYNLERKSMVFAAFGLLSEAARPHQAHQA